MASPSGFEHTPGFGPNSGLTYHGYAPPPAAPPPSAARRRPSRALVAGGGVAIALALGAAVGLLAKPELDVASDGPAKPMAPAKPGAQQGLTIQPGAPQTLALPQPTGKLQVLSPEMAAAARSAPVAAAPVGPSAVRDVSDVVPDPAPPPVALPRPPDPQFAAPSVTYPRMAAVGEGCAGEGGRAAQMICADPNFSAADREMNRAYRRALRSGALPPEQLRAEQQDWLAIREDAARHSPRALAQVYDQRIDELNQLADDGPG